MGGVPLECAVHSFILHFTLCSVQWLSYSVQCKTSWSVIECIVSGWSTELTQLLPSAKLSSSTSPSSLPSSPSPSSSSILSWDKYSRTGLQTTSHGVQLDSWWIDWPMFSLTVSLCSSTITEAIGKPEKEAQWVKIWFLLLFPIDEEICQRSESGGGSPISPIEEILNIWRTKGFIHR